jgi:hypothetical protein
VVRIDFPASTTRGHNVSRVPEKLWPFRFSSASHLTSSGGTFSVLVDVEKHSAMRAASFALHTGLSVSRSSIAAGTHRSLEGMA